MRRTAMAKPHESLELIAIVAWVFFLLFVVAPWILSQP